MPSLDTLQRRDNRFYFCLHTGAPILGDYLRYTKVRGIDVLHAILHWGHLDSDPVTGVLLYKALARIIVLLWNPGIERQIS